MYFREDLQRFGVDVDDQVEMIERLIELEEIGEDEDGLYWTASGDRLTVLS